MLSTYPKTSHYGGILLRRVVATLNAFQIPRPIDSHILIACSGGPDSVALAHLLCRYGRRIVARDRVKLLHINHHWRAEASDKDAVFVEKMAEKLGVGFIGEDLDPPKKKAGLSWENEARKARKKIFKKWAERDSALVLTAHHADDVAETVLRRFLSGDDEKLGQGILLKNGIELRPFLKVRKHEIINYLKGEGQDFRTDLTNDDTRFLRAKIRRDLMPAVNQIFPNASERLMELALKRQLRQIWQSDISSTRRK